MIKIRKAINMRKRIYEITELPDEKDPVSSLYDIVMFLALIISLFPLAFRENISLFYYSNIITTGLFIIDYILRFITADYRSKRKGAAAFILYPFTFWAIIDLLSILPGLIIINNLFELLKLFRVLRIFRVFRLFKTLKYSKNMLLVKKVLEDSKDALIAVYSLAIDYILISALIIYNVEPVTFGSYLDALYWATVSLTTIGYGDFYPVTTAGKVITIISSMVGIAIVALPTGIITASCMNVLYSKKDQ